MNATQETYAAAKAAYEVILQIEEEELKKIEYLMDENEEEYIKQEIAIGRRLNRRQFYTELRQAEDAMIAWANDKVSKSEHFTPKAAESMKLAMENIYNLKIRNTMVEIAFKLG